MGKINMLYLIPMVVGMSKVLEILKRLHILIQNQKQ